MSRVYRSLLFPVQASPSLGSSLRSGITLAALLIVSLTSFCGHLDPASARDTETRLGAQHTAVLLINFQDNPIEPYAPADARNVVFGTTNDFFLENSYQQTWLSGDVFGWYTIPLASTTCDGFQIRDSAKQAATAAGVDLSPYTIFVYAFPGNSACGYSGMSQIGGSSIWINGDLKLKNLAHELGHVLGLYHAHSLECGPTTLGSNCSIYEYGDPFDMMGYTTVVAHFNAFQKDRLGWLGNAVTSVDASGVYWLEPYEAAMGSHAKALKIKKETDPQTGGTTWYYVEFRQAIGFDSFLFGNSNVLNGVLIHTGSSGSGDSSQILDMTPSSFPWTGDDWRDPALVVGQSFFDSASGVTITPVSIDSVGVAVNVTLGAPTCIRAAPTMVLSPAQSQPVQAGTPVAYTVSVANNDSAGCAAASFSLRATVPTGWTAVYSTSTITLGPGANSATTLTVTSSATTGTGSYPVTAATTATGTYAASAKAFYVIPTALSVSTDKSSYSPGQTVRLTARAASGGSPLVKASVAFTITDPNSGVVATQTATTDSSGTATFKFRLTNKAPAGLYTGSASLTKPVAGSGKTSFMVQ